MQFPKIAIEVAHRRSKLLVKVSQQNWRHGDQEVASSRSTATERARDNVTTESDLACRVIETIGDK